ncbi:MAG: response regulator [Deltaproteobacteria bacterium]|nr:response regulator [Deltaproteobacteria bacterium]MBW1919940.1 response regulator [Deltaproteobacteria bacterium]MBW1934143.1 response regulator [Deltaproteobacteria bacterium]MBW1977144.1 response regulator [Deltaproteobacteria bacterium]MBW2043590.1 response regulator [Deltaproteobacteria bacterium]
MAGTKKILVADDEAGIRMLLYDALSGEGFKVALARDGEDSLNQMKKRRFDLLVTDINMPRVNGIELLRQMKKEGRREKIIVMTGNSVDFSSIGNEIPPVAGFLRKPFQIPMFLKVVASALGKATL